MNLVSAIVFYYCHLGNMTIGFESSLNIFDFPEIKICLVDDTAATAGSGYVVDLPVFQKMFLKLQITPLTLKDLPATLIHFH